MQPLTSLKSGINYRVILILFLIFCFVRANSQNITVDLSGRNLSRLPDSLFVDASRIDMLNLGSAGGIFVATYPEVRPLTFGTGFTNSFTHLDSRIGTLTNLKVIDLSFNDLKELPPEIYLLPIEEINLNFNHNFDLQGQSKSFLRLKKLKRLYLTGIAFETFPDDLLQSDVEELAVGNFNLTVDEHFVERISKLNNLKVLYLSDVKMDQLPLNLDT